MRYNALQAERLDASGTVQRRIDEASVQLADANTRYQELAAALHEEQEQRSALERRAEEAAAMLRAERVESVRVQGAASAWLLWHAPLLLCSASNMRLTCSSALSLFLQPSLLSSIPRRPPATASCWARWRRSRRRAPRWSRSWPRRTPSWLPRTTRSRRCRASC